MSIEDIRRVCRLQNNVRKSEELFLKAHSHKYIRKVGTGKSAHYFYKEGMLTSVNGKRQYDEKRIENIISEGGGKFIGIQRFPESMPDEEDFVMFNDTDFKYKSTMTIDFENLTVENVRKKIQDKRKEHKNKEQKDGIK